MSLKIRLHEPMVVGKEINGMKKDGTPYQLLTFIEKTKEGKEKYAKRIKCWVDNCPVPVHEGDMVSIEELLGVTWGVEKAQNGAWYDAISINARVMPVTGKQQTLDGINVQSDAEWTEMSDGDLPF